MTDDEFDSSREDETGASGEDPQARMDRVFEELYSNAEHPLLAGYTLTEI